LDIVAIEKLDTKGIIYIIGWIIGSLLVINILDALGILLAIVVPILMLIYKFKDRLKAFLPKFNLMCVTHGELLSFK
jgi:hypothetical protein